MKQSNNTRRRLARAGLAPERMPARPRQENDFTAEGSPPPGRVGGERPALPEDGQATPPAVADESGRR